MSSKGKQAVTNDGSDSKYREKVEDHYKGTLPCLQNFKIDFFRIKNCKSEFKMVFAFYVYGECFCRCSLFYEKIQGTISRLIFTRLFFQKMFWITTKATPEPFFWELATIGTFLPSIVGWSACAKVQNRHFIPFLTLASCPVEFR